MNITTQFTDYIKNTEWEDLPLDVRIRVKWCLVDWFACAIAGMDLQNSLKVIKALETWEGQGKCRVIGRGTKYSIEAASFLNSFISEVLEIGHGHAGGGGHLSGPTISVALAIGEEYNLDSRIVLTGIVVGYETLGKIGFATSPMLLNSGFIQTGLAGAFGATATAAKLFGLSHDQMRSSFGVSAYLTPLSLINEYKGAIKSAEAAQAAWVGVLGARLGSMGIDGSKDPIHDFCKSFSGVSRLKKYATELGSKYEILNLYFKPYPCCRFIHGALEAMSNLIYELDVNSDCIERIYVKVTPAAFRLCGNYLNTKSSFAQAQFSIPYAISTLIHDGSFTKDSLSRKRINRRFIHRLLENEYTRFSVRYFLRLSYMTGTFGMCSVLATCRRKNPETPLKRSKNMVA